MGAMEQRRSSVRRAVDLTAIGEATRQHPLRSVCYRPPRLLRTIREKSDSS